MRIAIASILCLVALVSLFSAQGVAAGKLQQAQTAPAALDLGEGVKLELVLIPAGKFMMGSPKDEEGRDGYEIRMMIAGKNDNEGPRHEVTISKPFYMGIYLVTQQQYQQVMGKNPSQSSNGPQYPVDNVNWAAANDFCTKLSQTTGKSVHLPTEAQWEYACRAGTTTPFNTGKTISTDQANFKGDDVYGKGKIGEYRRKTTPVDMFKPNAWGLYDMHGNLFQWCSDWYDKTITRRGRISIPPGRYCEWNQNVARRFVVFPTARLPLPLTGSRRASLRSPLFRISRGGRFARQSGRFEMTLSDNKGT